VRWPLTSVKLLDASDEVTGVRRLIAFAADDIWAVGDQLGPVYHDVSDGPRENSQGNKPFTLHWDGQAWREVAVPSLPGRTSSLSALSGENGDVWAVGTLRELAGIHGSGGNAASIERSEPVALRLVDGVWRRLAFPQMGQGGTGLVDVQVLAPDDVWVLGVVQATQEYAEPERTYPLLMRWDGNAWREITGPGNGATLNWYPWGMAAIADDDIWLLGMDNDSVLSVKHWDGTAWTSPGLPAVTERGQGTIGDTPQILAAAPDDVWVSWGRTVLPDDPLLWHWDGSAWSKIGASLP
jgi:hypothetical protein